jgi:CMP-N,N'-diacetyllegionaminic acid synthase
VILASICMRKGSKGVPRKNIRLLLDKPLLIYTFECVKESKRIDQIAVSSDDIEILDMASKHGVVNIFERSESLSSDSASKWDVFKDLVLRFEKKTNATIEYIVDLDVTVPRRKAEHIDSSIEMMMTNNVDVVITGYQPERNPYFNMMEVDHNNIATLVKKKEKPIVCRQDAPVVYSLTPAVYVIKRDALFNYQHWSEATCMINPIPREFAIDIDTESDFEFVEYLMKKELKNG